MARFGVGVERQGYERSRSAPGGTRAPAYAVEGDWSSASYLFAMAAALGGRVTVRNLDPASAQGDRRFAGALAAMGCRVSSGPDAVTVERAGPLRGIKFDMSTSPDTVQTLSMVAALAEGPTRITGIGHLKFKESDRLTGTADRLAALGPVRMSRRTRLPSTRPRCMAAPSTRQTTTGPRWRSPCSVLAIGGIAIEGAGCVKKSLPGFWSKLREAGLL